MIKRPVQEGEGTGQSSAGDILASGIQSVVLDPAPECVAKLLSLAVDHIDTLLEDWSVLWKIHNFSKVTFAPVLVKKTGY